MIRQYNGIIIDKWENVNSVSNFQSVLKLLKCSFLALCMFRRTHRQCVTQRLG